MPITSTIIASYPSRKETLLGMPIPKTPSEAFRQAAMLPIRYQCILLTDKGMMVEAHVVTHLDLESWADWHGYQVFELEKAELALPDERTVIG